MSEVPDITQLVVEFHDGPPEGLAALCATHGDDITVIESKGFSATAFTTQVVVAAVSSGTIRSLVPLVRAHIEARRHVTVRADGVEIQGLGAKDAIRVLEELSSSGGTVDPPADE